MNFTKKNIEKIKVINDNLLLFNPSSFIYKNTELKEFLSMANYYNKCLKDEFKEYGNIQDQLFYGSFFDEATKEVKTYSVNKVYSVLKCLAFMMAKDNFLTLQQTKIFLMQLENNKLL